jgi:hypothetical protein
MAPGSPSSQDDSKTIKQGIASRQNTIFLFKEKTAKTAYSELEHLLANGYEGLCVSRTPPERLRERYKLNKCTIFWLTGNKINDQNTLAPNELSRLAALLLRYFSSDGKEQNTKDVNNGQRVLLLDSIDYLILQNNFQTILRILHMLRDKIMLYPGIMLLPVDPLTFDQRELRLFERECEVIDVQDY